MSRRQTFLALALCVVAGAAHGAWPLVWDFAGRDDIPVAALRNDDGTLRVLVEAWAPGEAASRTMLLGIADDGSIAWTRELPALRGPVALAHGPAGETAVLARSASQLAMAVVTNDGQVRWSHSRGALAPEQRFFGPSAAPAWDAVGSAWRVPVGIAGDLAVLSFAADGTPLPDLRWSPPQGNGAANSVLSRVGGGLLVAGTVDTTPPGWWIVAFDASGTESWRHFEDGGTAAGTFSGAFLLQADPVIAWADDETTCGLFSVRLWSRDPASGAMRWARSWPANGAPPACNTFEPQSVRLADGRLLAYGTGDVSAASASFQSLVATFDADSGAPGWTASYDGASSPVATHALATSDGVLLASSLFPPVNPGPLPTWLSTWDRSGAPCTAPQRLVDGRVVDTLAAGADQALVVGYGQGLSSAGSASDVLVQRVDDPCAGHFGNGFEAD